MDNTNSSSNSKTLMTIIVILAVLMAAQTIGFLMYLSKKDTVAPTPSIAVKKAPHSTPTEKMAEPATPQAPAPRSFMDALQQSAQSGTPNYLKRRPNTAPSPLDDFEALEARVNQMMGSFLGQIPSMTQTFMNQSGMLGYMPTVDIEEKDGHYHVYVDLPGLEKDKINLTVKGSILTIEGERTSIEEVEEEGFYTQERSHGSFSRAVQLPGPVDDTQIEAAYENGVLKVSLPIVEVEEETEKKVAIS